MTCWKWRFFCNHLNLLGYLFWHGPCSLVWHPIMAYPRLSRSVLMSKRFVTGLSFVLISVFVLPCVSLAHTSAGAIAAVPTLQPDRIKRGVKRGTVTRAEARVLRAEQRKIAATKKRMLRDGRLNRAERKRLKRMQKRSNRHIVRAKRNMRRN